MNDALVEILILNYNGDTVIDECVQSIFDKTTYKNYTVVFVDNGSLDTSLPRMEKKYGVKVVFIKIPFNTGFSKGMNWGIGERLVKSTSNFFVLLNNDIVITDPDWIQKLLRPMTNDSAVGITCGSLTIPSGIRQAGGMMQFNGLTMSYIKRPSLDKDCFLDFAQMAACLVRREVLVKTKGFDEMYTPFNSEETDFSLRTKYLGYSIYFIHDLILFHKHGVSLKKVESLYRYYITKRNCVRFRMLHYPLHWLFFSVFLEYRVLLNILVFRDGKKIRFNRDWWKLLKVYCQAILANVWQIGEIVDRRAQLRTQKSAPVNPGLGE